MLDRTIPFYNTIMRCDGCQHIDLNLPSGFSIEPYKRGYEKAWAELEYGIGDFDSLEDAQQYFAETYLRDDAVTDNILFLLNEDGTVIGSCIAWRDMRNGYLVSSLHWLVVEDRYTGSGLGRALCSAVMNIYENKKQFPVYIHTQPWSWKAIFLYLSLGFRLQKVDTFSHYENEYDKAMGALRKIVSDEQYAILQELSEA